MKAKKIVAIVMGAAIAGTVAVGMSACTKKEEGPQSLGTTTFNVANYAEKYESQSSQQKSYKGLTSAKTLFSGKTVVGNLGNGQYITVSNEKYAVYDVVREKEILSNLLSVPQTTTLGSYGSGMRAIRVATSTENHNEYAYYAPDGTQILSAGEYQIFLATGQNGVYVGSDTEPCTVYTVVGAKSVVKDEVPTIEEVEVYLKAVTDEDTGLTSYSKITKDTIKAYSPDYEVGSDLSGLMYDLGGDEDHPLSGDIKDYKVSVLGNKYTFYKGSEKTGTVELNSNSEVLGVFNGSLYYREDKYYIEGDHSGYNIVEISDYSDSKYTSTLFKYDIVANTTTTLNYDVVIESLVPLYNYETKACDAAVISGYKMVDGVATHGLNTFTYVIDKDFNIGYDMTGIFRSVPDVYDIGGGKYYVGDRNTAYITDAELNVLSSAYNIDSIYVDESLVLLSRYVGTSTIYGFKDLSGKVVMAPEFSTESGAPVFYGGIAHVYSVDGEVLLKKDGTITKISDIEKSTAKNVEKTVEVKDGYYTVTTVTTPDEGDPTVKVEFYAFDGKMLKSFNHTDINVITVGGSTVIMENVTDVTSGDVTVSVYKLV